MKRQNNFTNMVNVLNEYFLVVHIMRLRPGFVGKFCLTAEDNVELRQRQIVALVINLNHLSERCTRSVDVQWFPHCTPRSSLFSGSAGILLCCDPDNLALNSLSRVFM